MRKQIEVLETHPDFAADLVDLFQVVGQLRPLDDDLAALVFLQPVDAADHGRLAGAGRSADDDPLAAHHLQIDIPQHVEITVPLVHIDDLNGHIRVRDAHFRTIYGNIVPFLQRYYS